MLTICIQMLWVLFEWLAFAFKCFDSRSNSSNLRSNDGIWLEWFEFAFECFESLRIWIQMLQISFEWLEFAFKHFESRSNSWNLHSNGENPFEYEVECFKSRSKGFKFAFEYFESISRNCIWMFQISFEYRSNIYLEFPFEWLELWICIRMLRISFKVFEFAFQCFESLSNG